VIVPDVNMVLYAHFTDYPQHQQARLWWEGLMNGTHEVGMSAPTLFGFVRVASNRRIFKVPLSVEAALAAVEEWLGRSHVHFIQPGPRHLTIAFDLLRRTGSGANLTTDAQIAALAIESQGEVHSNDTDFGRFPGLRWVNPLA